MVAAHILAASTVPGIPGVKWLGLILGLLLVVYAIRAMFGKKR